MSSNPTPFIALNKAIAANYALGATHALNELEKIKGLEKYYLYHTALGEVHFECGRKQEAKIYYIKALLLATSSAERQLLEGKISSCG